MTDAALALVLLIVARKARSLIMAGAFAVTGDFATAGRALLAAVSATIGHHLVLIAVGGIAVTLLAGKRRSPGRDFDLACVAVIPAIFIELCIQLVVLAVAVFPSELGQQIFGGLAYGWAIAILVLAVWVARRRTPDGTDAPPAVPVRARWAGRAFPVVAAVCIALNAAIVIRSPGSFVPARAGEVAPAFSLPVIGDDGRLGAERLSLSQLSGQVVMLEFWATWCRPCRASMPIASQVARRYEDRGVVLVSINVEGPQRARAARALADELGAHGILLAGDGHTGRAYGAATIPTFAIIDREGHLIAIRRGYPGPAQLTTWLEATLDAAL